MMSMIRTTKKLSDFETAKRNLTIEELLAELEAEENDGHDLVGETCFHIDFPDFRCKVLRVDDGRARVKVLNGWRGPQPPKDTVSVPTAKLEVLS